MRNKIIAILLSAIMVISLSACGGTETSNNDKEVEDLKNQIAELKAQNAELQKQLAESTQGNADDNNNSSASASINESTAETWGVCGADLTWYYQNGTLVIRGTGEMTDYSRIVDQPWADIRNKIQWIYIEDGITYIGRSAFYNCEYLSKAEIPNSVTVIGGDAFYGCDSLTSITIPDSVTTIEGYAFQESGLTSITLPASVSVVKHQAFWKCSSLEEIIILNDNIALDDGICLDGTRVVIDGTEYIWGGDSIPNIVHPEAIKVPTSTDNGTQD